jgi:hypothetical protein
MEAMQQTIFVISIISLCVVLACPLVATYDDSAIQYYNERNHLFELLQYADA